MLKGKAILLSDNNHEVINLKGVDPDNTDLSWGPANKIVSGNFDLLKGNNGLDKIILGSQMALRLSRFVGDTVLATSFGDLENSLLTYTLPATKRFIVAGIFQTKNKEYDYNYVFTNLKSAQTLVGLRKQISGIEIRVTDISNSEKIKSPWNQNLRNLIFQFIHGMIFIKIYMM